nr:DedA family protein [Wohlfahrtiimonas chitiniclastica]
MATSAFTSATILPGSSEVALLAFLAKFPEAAGLALIIASIANALGSITSLILGRLIPPKQLPSVKVQNYLTRYGSPVLLLSWVPLIGDALPLAAGWLRLPMFACSVYLLIGKMARYGMIILLFFWK